MVAVSPWFYRQHWLGMVLIALLALPVALGCGQNESDDSGGGGGGGGGGSGSPDLADILDEDVVDTVKRLLNTSLIVSASYQSNCAMITTDEGERITKCWGSNSGGQLGNGKNRENTGDDPNEMGDNLDPIDVGTDLRVITIVAGRSHACGFLDKPSGERLIKCWGSSLEGKLGIGSGGQTGTTIGDEAGEMGDNLKAVDFGTDDADKPYQILSISAGDRHTCAVLQASNGEGVLKCWGANGKGQLGLGDTDYRGDKPSTIGNGMEPVELGSYKDERISPQVVSAGAEHTCAIGKISTGERVLKCWGNNDRGRLGLGDEDNRGHNQDTVPAKLEAVELGTYEGERLDPVAIATGFSHTCAIGRIPSGTKVVKCWGSNGTSSAGTNGALGTGDKKHRGHTEETVPAEIDAIALGSYENEALEPIAIQAGLQSSCVVTEVASGNRFVKCWGRNDEGQLGLGDTDPRGMSGGTTPDTYDPITMGSDDNPVAITNFSMGYNHTCVTLQETMSGTHIAKCWGDGSLGQLGIGSVDDLGLSQDTIPAKIKPIEF